MDDENRLIGGRMGGATRVGDTVRRPGRPWSPAVAALLEHLEAVGFEGAPRYLGPDEHGRDVVRFIAGQTLGEPAAWPAWTRSDVVLANVGAWLRRLHEATATWRPPPEAVWFSGRPWAPGLIIGHQDAAPWNAVIGDDDKVAFVDWDTAGPSAPELDLAWTALTWTPLLDPHPDPGRHLDLDEQHHRFHLLLDSYDQPDRTTMNRTTTDRTTMGAVIARRARINAAVIHRLAASGDATGRQLLPWAATLENTATRIEALPPSFWKRR